MVIHVRPIANGEGNRLRQVVRHGKDPIEVKRAQVILSSAQGFAPPRIADTVMMTPAYVRELIHWFDKEGFVSQPFKAEAFIAGTDISIITGLYMFLS